MSHRFTTTTTASVHVIAWHLTACVWLGWTVALHGVSVGMVLSYSGWLNWYAAAAAVVCVWSHRPPHARTPTPAWRLSGLLMVHAVLTLAVNLLIYGCVAWPAYKPTPKALSLKFSQELSAYTWVYTVVSTYSTVSNGLVIIYVSALSPDYHFCTMT